MYKPSKIYKVKIRENPAERKFFLWFDEEPESLVRNILRAMGFRVKDHGQEFYHTESKFKLGFAKEFASALAKGQFPTTIPYIPSNHPDITSITGDRFSIVHISPELSNISKKEKVLIFETATDKKDGLGYLVTWLRYPEKIDSVLFRAIYRISRNEAKELLEKKDENVVASLPNPFGSFGKKIDLDGLNATSNLDHIYRQENDEFKSARVNSEKEAPVRDIPSESSPEKAPVRDISSETETYFIKKQEDTLLPSENSRTGGLSRELPSESSQEKNIEEEDQEQIDTNTDLEDEDDFQERGVKVKNNSTSCYEEIIQLLPDLQNQLERQVRNSSSYADVIYTFDHLEFHSLEKRSDTIYLLQLDFNYSNELGLTPPVIVQFVIDFHHQELTIEDWKNDENHVLDSSQVANSIEQFKEMIEEARRVGHVFKLEDEKVENNHPFKKGQLKEITIERPILGGNEFEQLRFYSWQAANQYLRNPKSKIYHSKQKVKYHIEWSTNHLSGEFNMGLVSINPDFHLNAIGRAAFKKLLDLKYLKEGRFNKSQKINDQSEELESVDFEKLIEELDFGINKDATRRDFQPTIPIRKIEVTGTQISLYELTVNYQGQFDAANGKLDSFAKVSSDNHTAKITAVWKDNTILEKSILYSQLPSVSNEYTWRAWLKDEFSKRHSYQYQTADTQPLLFDYEIEYPQPHAYYSLLVDAYWRTSDTEKLKYFHPYAHAYHTDRLAMVIIGYLEDTDFTQSKYKYFRTEVNNPIDTGSLLRKVFQSIKDSKLAEEKVTAISELFNSVSRHDKKAVEALAAILNMIISESKKLADLPTLKEDANGTQQEGKKLSRRVDLNQSIETLLDKNGKKRSNYSDQELQLLSKYSGYGGTKLSETNRGLLYEYYTPDEIVKMMWILAHEFGYQAGAVLEPSCGIGSFLKYAPKNARIEGYETNPYSAQIAQILYPHASIHNKSFEELFFNGFTFLNGRYRTEPFDLVIGNPPYGEFSGKYAGLGEKKRTHAVNYEHYFLTRGIDILNPNGLLIYVIPNSFLRNGNKYSKLKMKLAEKCTLEFSWRLTKDVFKHTSIETDIIVLRKRNFKEDEQ